MNAAVLPSYGFTGSSPEGSQDVPQSFAAPPTRMSHKRRRVDQSGEYGTPSPAGWETTDPGQRDAQQFAPAVFASITNLGGAQFSSPANGGENAAASTSMSEPSDPPDRWRGTDPSPYPDVSSYSHQPYFYQQTHPSTYNSPWPPSESASFGTQSNPYHPPPPPSSQSAEMPYFPQQSRTATSEAHLDPTTIQQSQSQSLPSLGPGNSAGVPFAYASRNANGLPRSDIPLGESAFSYEDVSMHLKVQSLPILENLATQLIHTIASASFPQIQETMKGNDDEDSQAYTTLKSLFDQTRKVYSRETPFIDAIAIQMFQPSQQETIRKANIATFLSNILGANDVSFFHLNEFFTETFVPLGHRLLKWQGAVFLELKTQTYISALMNSDGNPESMLDELFPSDLDAQILTRHPDAPSLSPSEQDFIDRSRARRSYLLAEDYTDEAVRELRKKYQWSDFVREFALSVSKNVDGLLNIPTRNQSGAGTNDKRAGAAQVLQDSLSRNGLTAANNGGALATPRSLSLPGTSVGQSRDEGSKKSNATASTVRQPWTKPEEEALLSGLEKVNGPHWSQILALYGRGGSASEVLKDRNQVQLKDKARNLKLWYLKMGKEVPQALRGVTGELRKRGGARARAALGVTDGDEQTGDADDGDADGEADMEGTKGGVDRNPSTRSARTSVRRKSKKGS